MKRSESRAGSWARLFSGASLTTAALLGGCKGAVMGDSRIPTSPCGSSEGPCSVSIAPASASLKVGDSITFVAGASADVPYPRNFRWSSADASKVSIDALGRARALVLSAGTVVCVELVGKSACGVVTVVP